MITENENFIETTWYINDSKVEISIDKSNRIFTLNIRKFYLQFYYCCITEYIKGYENNRITYYFLDRDNYFSFDKYKLILKTILKIEDGSFVKTDVMEFENSSQMNLFMRMLYEFLKKYQNVWV